MYFLTKSELVFFYYNNLLFSTYFVRDEKITTIHENYNTRHLPRFILYIDIPNSKVYNKERVRNFWYRPKINRRETREKLFLYKTITSVHKFVRTVYEYFAYEPKSFYEQSNHMLLKRRQLVIDNDGTFIID